jgi:hypothetical protein
VSLIIKSNIIIYYHNPYRFASKTLMRILPDPLRTDVEDLINKKTITLDLYEILGQCTWGKGKEAGKSL